MTPRIEHVALWTSNLERMRAFYEQYFDARAGTLYRSATRAGFASYFLSFPDRGGRLELMTVPEIAPAASTTPFTGYAHIAVTVGPRANVDALTERMRRDGVRVISGPRQTGDGYYESVVADPDGNEVELVAEM